MCRPTIWNPTGSPLAVLLPGNVSVGWPLILNGAVRRMRACTPSGVRRAGAISSKVGAAACIAGMISKSILRKSALSWPRNASRQSKILAIVRPSRARPDSNNPASTGPYSGARDGKVASCATAPQQSLLFLSHWALARRIASCPADAICWRTINELDNARPVVEFKCQLRLTVQLFRNHPACRKAARLSKQ
jgi:hypothetical protein